MILSCSSCQTQFRVDDERLVPDGKTVRCSKCGYVWRAMPDGQPGAEAAPPPAPIQTEASPAAGMPPQDTPAPEHAGERAAAVLSARNPVDDDDGEQDGDGESKGQDTDKTEAVTAEATGAYGLTVEQRAKLTAAREKKPRSRFWIKVLVVFVIVAGLLLVAQQMMLKSDLGKAGPDIEQPAADVGEVEAKPVPTDSATKPAK